MSLLIGVRPAGNMGSCNWGMAGNRLVSLAATPSRNPKPDFRVESFSCRLAAPLPDRGKRAVNNFFVPPIFQCFALHTPTKVRYPIHFEIRTSESTINARVEPANPPPGGLHPVSPHVHGSWQTSGAGGPMPGR